jgi:hypothetical protein
MIVVQLIKKFIASGEVAMENRSAHQHILSHVTNHLQLKSQQRPC